MLKRTSGIVLKSTLFGEADLIVTYLTPDYGLLKVFVKSPRKVKSRFGSSLEPLTYAKISFFGKEESALPRLTQSDIIRPFHALREDFTCFLNISEMLELNLNFLPEREPNAGIFKLLLTTLVRLESSCRNPLYYLYYKMRFLDMAGYSPRLDACGRCGTVLADSDAQQRRMQGEAGTRHHFYVSHGSVLCGRCGENGNEPLHLTHSALKFYKSLLRWHPAAINRIKAPEQLMSEINGIINSHIRYVLGSPRFPRKKSFENVRQLS